MNDAQKWNEPYACRDERVVHLTFGPTTALCYVNLSGGDMSKCPFSYDQGLTTNKGNDSNKVQFCNLWELLGIPMGV